MIRSMTGFGTRNREIAGDHYLIEIRSVNGRYYKANIRLPELWSHLESDIDRIMRIRLHRGSVQFTMKLRGASTESADLVNIPLMERYIEQLDIIRPDQTEVDLSVDLAGLMLLPGVCTPPEPEEMPEESKSELLKLTEETIDALIQMRTEEGKIIAEDLLAQSGVIEKHLVEIAGMAGKVVEKYHQRLKQRVTELTGSAELKLNEQDLAREVAIFAERCDIAEEILRLTGHLKQFRIVMDSADQPGRKLDFLAQEMLREANTTSAKANDGNISRAVVEIKTAIDRIKEQVQNVE